jgi:hypothetical protein
MQSGANCFPRVCLTRHTSSTGSQSYASGPAPLTLFALTLRGNRRRDGNPAILCETAEAE